MACTLLQTMQLEPLTLTEWFPEAHPASEAGSAPRDDPDTGQAAAWSAEEVPEPTHGGCAVDRRVSELCCAGLKLSSTPTGQGS